MQDEETQPSWIERLVHALLPEPKDRQQLIQVLREARTHDILDADALRMIEGVLQVSEMQVRDIMVPRAQMVVVEQTTPWDELLPIIIESQHSRFPVIGENRNDIVGLLLAKDLLRYVPQDATTFNINDIMRPTVFVPESKRLDNLLDEFRVTRNHMAIVVDEYGGVAGLVTIEDVLEEIVGEIEDEFDVEKTNTNIKMLNKRQFTVKALTPIDDFNQHFDTDYSDEQFDTIGGLVMQQFGHLPKRGESVEIAPFRFKVLHADKRRIGLLLITRLAKESKQ